MMKVLFLDVDGVLNNYNTKSMRGLTRKTLRVLSMLVDDLDCQLVLISEWRKYPDLRDHLTRKLGYRKLELYSDTPVLPRSTRGMEVRLWLLKHPFIQNYAIVSPYSDFLTEQKKHLVETNYEFGLTQGTAHQIMRILS